MLKSITMKFSDAPTRLQIPNEGITIFVGPNNSGKSLILREIEADISSIDPVKYILLEGIEKAWPEKAQLEEDIRRIERIDSEEGSAEYRNIGKFSASGDLETSRLSVRALWDFHGNESALRWFTTSFFRFFLLRLDGRTRFNLTNDQPRGDLTRTAPNFLAHIFKNDPLRKKIRAIINDALGTHFTIDALMGDKLRIRLSDTEPTIDEQNLNQAARTYHKNAVHIKEASDGAQAFIGIICAVLSGNSRLILIDEPEAFLHPPLARKLGFQLTANLQAGAALMASTHSADFLIGCLQASSNVRVIRLQYTRGRSKGNIIDPVVLSKFFKSPLLRSANVISSLFYDGVVVTESDNDRVFYSEIYYRLAEAEKGYPSILFVNAQNKQTIHDIIGPLRKIGIPAAAIADIDILKDGGQTWTSWLESAGIPKILRNGYGVQRGNILSCFESEKIDMKKTGVDGLQDSEKLAANELFNTLDSYGVFSVRGGELESWLKGLKVPGKKTDWTIAMLEKMGDEPTKPNYVRPAEDDVWQFIRGIILWVRDPARKGME